MRDEPLIAAPLSALRSYARLRGIEELAAVHIYEQELTRLGRFARVDRFVPVLAERHTKEVLRIAALR